MKKIVKESLNYRMSPEEFKTWFENLYNEYSAEEWEPILSTLMNDEYSTDEELDQYMQDELDVDPTLIEVLLDKRQFFLDFRYAQLIDIS